MQLKLISIILLMIISACLGGAGMHYYIKPNKDINKEIQTTDREGGPVGVKVRFSPKGGCTEAIVYAINNATKSILVQAYSFTSDAIETALIDAHRRGVDVHVILDRSQYEMKGTATDNLFTAGVDVKMDKKHAIAHNKVMVIDGFSVITGSFNFTRQAEISNAENLLILNSSNLAALYTDNWNVHYAHSEPYVRPK